MNYPALKQDLAVSRARESQAYETYKKAVLVAFEDVDNSLVAYNSEKVRQNALREEAAQDERAFNIAQDKYSRGLTNYLNVLDARRVWLQSQNTLLESRAAVSTDLASFYKAVGGGWELNDPALAGLGKVR